MESNQQLQAALKQHFGFSAFRGRQQDIIANVVAGRDTMVIMPTGAGKSLCFQLPALVREGVTLVVSPLVALMKDQVDSLLALGIAATTINSSVSSSEQRQRLIDIGRGRYKLVYVAPERFTPAFIARMQTINVGLLAIDEAHCLSQWGHDFRPDYLKLGRVRQELGFLPTIALTATATPEVQQDIAQVLGMENCTRYVTGFDRPNLELEVRKISGKNERKYEQLRSVLSSIQGVKLIYCATRKNVERVTAHLRENGIMAGMYHAGLSMQERTDVQNAFMYGLIDTVVATNAFGMGVDKSDIRCVVHWEFPGTVEAYYQEIGRAGRDGQPSKVVLLYRAIDDQVQRTFIEASYPSKEWVEQVWVTLQSLVRRNNHNVTLWIGHEELAELLPSDINGRAVGACFYTLDREGYIRRLSSNHRKGQVWLAQSPKRHPSGIRGKVYDHIAHSLQGYDGYSIEVNPEHLASDLELSKDQLMAALHALRDAKLIRWEAPERVGGVELLRYGEPLVINEELILRRRNHEFKKLELMKAYAESECRRRYLITYFGEDAPFERCGTCDRCCNGGGQAKPVEALQLLEIKKILSCLARMSLRVSYNRDPFRGFGRNVLIKTLKGSTEKAVVNWGFDGLSTHGILKGCDSQHLHDLLDELVRIELLETQYVTKQFGGNSKEVTFAEYRMTEQGNSVMRGQLTQFDIRFPTHYAFASSGRFGSRGLKPKSKHGSSSKGVSSNRNEDIGKHNAQLSAFETALYEQLSAARKALAQRDDVPLYSVATNRSLRDMAHKRPQTPQGLRQIHGMGPMRIRKYGRRFIEVINGFKFE